MDDMIACTLGFLNYALHSAGERALSRQEDVGTDILHFLFKKRKEQVSCVPPEGAHQAYSYHSRRLLHK